LAESSSALPAKSFDFLAAWSSDLDSLSADDALAADFEPPPMSIPDMSRSTWERAFEESTSSCTLSFLAIYRLYFFKGED
jgi:hypothetical protein